MKASAFAYARAASVVNALELLGAYGDTAKVLSGGQSLMPAMNLRLISPELIVDIGDLAELRGIAVKGDVLTVGALRRHVDLLASPEIATHAPLLSEAVAHVGHPAIRNRGTLGGSLAHADPASKFPACMVALNATMVVRDQAGVGELRPRISSREFMRRRYRSKNCLSPLNCRSHQRIPRISFANWPGGMGTMRLSGWRRRRSCDAISLRTLGIMARGRYRYGSCQATQALGG
jgi:CO/xanthine dehydrogenase FAD-binding subunit